MTTARQVERPGRWRRRASTSAAAPEPTSGVDRASRARLTKKAACPGGPGSGDAFGGRVVAVRLERECLDRDVRIECDLRKERADLAARDLLDGVPEPRLHR